MLIKAGGLGEAVSLARLRRAAVRRCQLVKGVWYVWI